VQSVSWDFWSFWRRLIRIGRPGSICRAWSFCSSKYVLVDFLAPVLYWQHDGLNFQAWQRSVNTKFAQATTVYAQRKGDPIPDTNYDSAQVLVKFISPQIPNAGLLITTLIFPPVRTACQRISPSDWETLYAQIKRHVSIRGPGHEFQLGLC
jgi:hypothetical protein